MGISTPDRERIQNWCEARIPREYADQMRLGVRFRGNSATIFDLRPPWRHELGAEWTEQRVAKLTYEPTTGAWRLFATDRNDHLLHYSQEFGLSAKLDRLLEEIDKDPTSIFWG